ncbi:MAG: citramalate synthase [Candidatus Hydrothermarchaeota archaeon]|nr:citramalate synthase [Candidatus Hydrothermarchaeota archaeon]
MVRIYDTTLRDGSQSEHISFSLEDKLRIAKKLDELGVHYIEGGWPGSNPKDVEFFRKVKALRLKSKIVAFGSTRKAKNKVEKDQNIKALLKAGTSAVCVFGKSWDLHIRDALGISLEQNLELIEDSISYLKSKRKEVIYDAEHFFDAYKRNADYAMQTLKVAQAAGADVIVLCDTNGGAMPYEVQETFAEVRKRISAPLGIHAHNDADTAVANTIAAVKMGAEQVQGTINGYGERCGNANLCSIIPNLKLKLGIDCLDSRQLKKLTEVSRFVSEIANLSHQNNTPYVGSSAFAHKGGIHVSAVLKNPETYEHVKPELIGNRRRILISELSGRGSILTKAEEYRLDLREDTPQTQKILKMLKDLENQGYQFEGAEASFELLMKKALGTYRSFFELEEFRVIVDTRGDELIAEATVKVRVDGKEEHTAAEGNGPVNALDNALRKALEKFYPVLKEVHLTDYKVRVLDTREGTAAKVRVLIQSSDDKSSWGTVGVSENIIEASFEALADSIQYKLMKSQHFETLRPSNIGTVRVSRAETQSCTCVASDKVGQDTRRNE